MSKEDYFKYYIQNFNHYFIPKDIFDELFNEMDNWKQEVKKYKDVIDKARTKAIHLQERYDYILDDLIFLLKEVE